MSYTLGAVFCACGAVSCAYGAVSCDLGAVSCIHGQSDPVSVCLLAVAQFDL